MLRRTCKTTWAFKSIPSHPIPFDPFYSTIDLRSHHSTLTIQSDTFPLLYPFRSIPSHPISSHSSKALPRRRTCSNRSLALSSLDPWYLSTKRSRYLIQIGFTCGKVNKLTPCTSTATRKNRQTLPSLGFFNTHLKQQKRTQKLCNPEVISNISFLREYSVLLTRKGQETLWRLRLQNHIGIRCASTVALPSRRP